MPSWEWALVALLAFGALQLLALRYALRGEGPEVGGQGPVAYAADPDRPGDVEVVDGSLRCPRCDAENRPGFSYCRNCAGFLPG